MHPRASFHWQDRGEMAAFVAREGFGQLIVQTEAGLRAVHVPVLVDGGRLLFHVARANLVHAALAAGGAALIIVNGPHAYISPDWYGLPDKVPTWNYVSVEVNGPVLPLSREALIELLDAQSAEFEARLSPKPAWRREDMAPERFEALLGGITGFALEAREWRGTRKLGQGLSEEVCERVAGAAENAGWAELAREMRA
jgi:transcriptional regulator